MKSKNPILICLFIFLLFCSQSLVAQYNFSTVDEALRKSQSTLGKNSVVLVYKDGKIIYKKESGNFTLQTQEPIASCSKWLTAALVMTFVDEGQLSLDDKVSSYIPAFKIEGKENITIKQCLSQMTGIHQEPINLMKLLTQKKYKTLQEEVNDFATRRTSDFASGSGFFYGNVGLNTAARVLEVIAKKDFSQLMTERILEPLEMNNTHFGKKNVAPNPSGGAVSTPNDYLNFLIMLVNKGTFKGKKILSEKAINAIKTPQTTLDKIKYAPKVAEGFNYALGCWIEETDSNGNPIVLTCPGLFGTWPLVDFKKGYACLFFVKSLLNEQKGSTYVAVKKSIDRVVETK
ncbi:MAG: serine hydrolase [Flavobacterium sp.]